MPVKGKKYYICWYVLDGLHGYLLWYSNDSDGVLVDNGKILVFPEKEQLSRYAAFHNIKIQPEEPILHDLDILSRWLIRPDHKKVNCNTFCAVWNLFKDVSASVGGDFDPDHNKTQKIYDMIFHGQNLPSMTPPGDKYEPIWTEKEVQLMQDILSHGLELFRSCIAEIEQKKGVRP